MDQKQLVVDLLAADPAAPTVTPQGTAGSTTYGYKIVGVTANGNETAASAEGTTATGNAVLDGTNFNRITWTDVAGAATYKIYRTTGGATSGLIGEVAAGAGTFDDTGLVGDASTPSATNATGTAAGLQVLQDADKTIQVSSAGGTQFVGTVRIEGTIDRLEWHPVCADFVSVGGLAMIAESIEAIRVRVLAYTSGSINVHLGSTRGTL